MCLYFTENVKIYGNSSRYHGNIGIDADAVCHM